MWKHLLRLSQFKNLFKHHYKHLVKDVLTSIPQFQVTMFLQYWRAPVRWGPRLKFHWKVRHHIPHSRVELRANQPRELGAGRLGAALAAAAARNQNKIFITQPLNYVARLLGPAWLSWMLILLVTYCGGGQINSKNNFLASLALCLQITHYINGNGK